jgi:hypothetical protein
MRQRCQNPKNPSFAYYGGRGIVVCARWSSFGLFLADVGRRPSSNHSLDRIDTNGHYEPGNVRWATAKVQNRNKRSNSELTIAGETLTVAEWAERTGVDPSTLHKRIRAGWEPELCVLPAGKPGWRPRRAS